MAEMLKFRRNVTDLDLNTLLGFSLPEENWAPKIAASTPGRIPPYVVEEMPLRLRRSTTNEVATSMQALAEMQEAAARYMADRTEYYPVWLHDQAAAETGGRRVLVARMLGDPHMGWHNDWNDPNFLFQTMAVERHPYWEPLTYVSGPVETLPAPAASVAYDYTAAPGVDVVGDAPARIGLLELGPPVGGAGANLDRFWVGLRGGAKHGPLLADFANIWECELGTLGTDATLEHDAAASPGGAGHTYVAVTPGTATWAKRLTLRLVDIIGALGNEPAQFGYFQRLLRAKVTGGTWEVQLRYGYRDWADANFVPGSKVAISNTSWDIFEMGLSSLPLHDLRMYITNSAQCWYEVQFWARRTVGTDTLDLDCLLPIPVDEGMLWVKDAQLQGAIQSSYAHFSMLPHDVPTAASAGINLAWAPTSNLHALPAYGAPGFYLPVGDGRMIIVCARATSSVLTDQLRIAYPQWYPRWLSLRGAE